ncbi:MAG: class I SAM-dependent methyltransferase [Alphaproteobacteria bacterium]|nr:class I SAM-dependent methyltransferase [Alphaproteobacteria bacterium]
MSVDKERHEANRASWNAATAAHNSHKLDQAGFLARGGSTLFPEELELLGPLDGLRLLHLQCNAGQDSLSLAALGAEVTGVDISDVAISEASALSAASGIPARFERADVYDWLAAAEGAGFDRVFSSYGAICWLSDLRLWARGVASALAPGGQLVVMEFHPAAMMFNEKLELTYGYFAGEPLVWEDGVSDYVARSEGGLSPSGHAAGVVDFKNPHPAHEFQWSIADILGALLDAGLILRRFTEYPHSNGCVFFEGSHLDAQRRAHVPEGRPSVPQMYGLIAEKPSAISSN